jgi:hypothetical protein
LESLIADPSLALGLRRRSSSARQGGAFQSQMAAILTLSFASFHSSHSCGGRPKVESMSPRHLFNVPPAHRAFDALETVRHLAEQAAGYYPLERSHLDAVLKTGDEAVLALRELGHNDNGEVSELRQALDELAADPGGPECWRDRLDWLARRADDLLKRLPAKPERRTIPMYRMAEIIASAIDEAPPGSARGLVRVLHQTVQAAEYEPLKTGRARRRRT